MSGPHGEDFGVQREVEDMQALIAATGARFIFGLSSGALVSLRTALFTPTVGRVALYEPPLWIKARRRRPGYRASTGKSPLAGLVGALVTAMKGMGVEPLFARMPRFVLAPSRGPRPACPDGRR
jgi:pimeloyl-ACP methyl ester carboxylesterase